MPDINEVDERSQEMLLGFLQTHFPVKKLKNGKGFKRGIILDDGFTGGITGKIFLKPQSEINALFAILSKVLRNVYGFSDYEINIALFKYFKII